LPRLWWLSRRAVTETRTVSVPVRVPSHPGLVKHGRMTDRVSSAPAQARARPSEINLAEHRIRRKQVLGGLTHEYQIAA
jgi:hypothetical protein